ncbi:MAG: hypothetical protein Q4E36_06045 [Bacillota bacterium]|nr:hypothetical protein [Bacillota bacterium]
MKNFKKNFLDLESDFPIKILNNFAEDQDLIINLQSRVVNLIFKDVENFPVSRFQLTEVKSILIRHSLRIDIKLGTIHFLRVIDLNSSLLNFSLDLENYKISIEDKSTHVDVFCGKKKGL